MQPTDKPAFVAALVRTFRFAGKDITADPALIADWLDEFADVPFAMLDAALRQHRRESVYPPKPADVYRHLEAFADNRPGPDEAWGALVRIIRDERETGVLCDEMRGAWQACQPILDLGDEVGARRCFIETYARLVAEAKRAGIPARWSPTLGTDPALRQQRLNEAVQAQRLSADHAMTLLPALTSPSEPVAGLLAGPVSGEQAETLREQFRELAAHLRGTTATDEAKREEQRRQRQERQRAVEDTLKAQIQALMDERAQRAKRDASAAQIVQATEFTEDVKDNANFQPKNPINENSHFNGRNAA